MNVDRTLPAAVLNTTKLPSRTASEPMQMSAGAPRLKADTKAPSPDSSPDCVGEDASGPPELPDLAPRGDGRVFAEGMQPGGRPKTVTASIFHHERQPFRDPPPAILNFIRHLNAGSPPGLHASSETPPGPVEVAQPAAADPVAGQPAD